MRKRLRRLVVSLPADRNYAGTLHVEDRDGRRLAGPFAVSGRAHDVVAGRHDNPARNPLLPYGDTPLGRYRVAAIVASGPGTDLPANQFGPNGVIVLEPIGGDASLADANGRFRLLIQGGRLGAKRALRSTAGALRLANAHQRRLVDALRRVDAGVCECTLHAAPVSTIRVVCETPDHEEDPPRLPVAAIRSRTRPGGGVPGARRYRGSMPPSFSLFFEGGGGGGGGQGGGGGTDYDWGEEKPTIGEFIKNKISEAGSALQSAAQKDVPNKLADAAGQAVVNQINALQQKQGQPLDAATSAQIRVGTTAAIAAAAKGLGLQVTDHLQSALNQVAPAEANSPFPPLQKKPEITSDVVASLGVGAYSLNTKGQLGLQYNWTDFAQYKSFNTAIAPLTSNLNQLSIKASTGGADYSAQFSTNLTIGNPAGTIHFKNVNISFSFKF